jgi:hypothetical protein
MDDLEQDLLKSEMIMEKVKNVKYAQSLYAALCNNDFVKSDDAEEPWSCSWRYAGGLVSLMRGNRDYLEFYCSGIGGNSISEGDVTEEICDDLKKLGWTVNREYSK